jgi:hypothetical protein
VPAIPFGSVPMPCSIGNSANIARGKPACAPRKFFCVIARWLLWHSTRAARTVAVPAIGHAPPLTRGTMTCAAVDPPRYSAAFKVHYPPRLIIVLTERVCQGAKRYSRNPWTEQNSPG